MAVALEQCWLFGGWIDVTSLCVFVQLEPLLLLSILFVMALCSFKFPEPIFSFCRRELFETDRGR